MASEASPVCGGVKLFHTECAGKHSYEVKGFLNHNKGMFTRTGDKLIMINNTKVEDLTPTSLADLLVEGSTLLTIHHPSKNKSNEECESEELSVDNKERTIMSFSLLMVRDVELEVDVLPESDSECEDEIEDKLFSDKNLLIVSMEDASFNMVVARGCDPDNPCNDCGKTNCQLNDVVVLPTNAKISSCPSKVLHFKKENNNLFLKSLFNEKYVSPNNRQICLNSTMSAPITIYSYRVNSVDNPGVPVVLNFTGTQNFFSCTVKQDGDTKILTVKSYSKSELKKICAGDTDKWSLVFYKSCGPDCFQRFESALHRGWFICTRNIANDDVDVYMGRDVERDKPLNTFFVIIESEKAIC
ncbi:interleukin-1 family member A [Danio aesculapii]|uniref:interleukin-1 family member A n=1 Tax=Danio aesculapii TaxID=1142201 RepID=UPI0024BFAB6C|nr:interleukin-1 family member A [Danio aesculapii]